MYWLHLLIQFPEAVVEEAAGEAAKAQIGAEACGAGQQGGGVHPWSLIVGDPGLAEENQNKKEPTCLQSFPNSLASQASNLLPTKLQEVRHLLLPWALLPSC